MPVLGRVVDAWGAGLVGVFVVGWEVVGVSAVDPPAGHGPGAGGEPAGTSAAVAVLSRGAAREVTEAIRAGVVRAVEALGEVEDLVARAYAGRVWLGLGYPSWDEYCAGELSGARLWESVAQRRGMTSRLLGAGLSQRAVAAVLGVDHRTVGNDRRVAVSTGECSPVDSSLAGTGGGRSVGLDGRVRPGRRLDTAQGRVRQEAVLGLRALGRTQVQIAGELGVAQSTVSAYLSAAEARGLLDPASLLASAGAGPSDPDGPDGQEPGAAAAAGTGGVGGAGGVGGVVRSRAGALLAEARVRAVAVDKHVRVLRAQVVDADEWTSDALFAADVDAAVGQTLAGVAGELGYVLGHLDRGPATVPVPGDGHVHVRRARRVRQIADLLDAGASPAQVAADLGIRAEAVVRVLAELDALPTDRRAGGEQSDPTR